jgi:phasin family protein
MATTKPGFDPARVQATLGEQFQAHIENMQAMVNAIVQGAERLSEIQLAAVREAQEQQRRVLEALGKPGGQQDLAALQSSLFNETMNGWVRYWTRVAELAQQTQADLTRVGQQATSRAMREVKGK